MIELLYRHQAYPGVQAELEQSAGKQDPGRFGIFPGPRCLIRPIETFSIVTNVTYFRNHPSQTPPLSYNPEQHLSASSKRRGLLR